MYKYRLFLAILVLSVSHITQASADTALQRLESLGQQLIDNYKATASKFLTIKPTADNVRTIKGFAALHTPLVTRVTTLVAAGTDPGEKKLGLAKSSAPSYLTGRKYGIGKTRATIKQKTSIMTGMVRLAFLAYNDISGVLDLTINKIFDAAKLNTKVSERERNHATLAHFAYDYMKMAIPLYKKALDASQPISLEALKKKIEDNSKNLSSSLAFLPEDRKDRIIKYFYDLSSTLTEIIPSSIRSMGSIMMAEYTESEKDELKRMQSRWADATLLRKQIKTYLKTKEDKAKEEEDSSSVPDAPVLGMDSAPDAPPLLPSEELESSPSSSALVSKSQPLKPIASSSPLSIADALKDAPKLKPATDRIMPPSRPQATTGSGSLAAALQQSLLRYRAYVQDEENDEEGDKEWE